MQITSAAGRDNLKKKERTYQQKSVCGFGYQNQCILHPEQLVNISFTPSLEVQLFMGSIAAAPPQFIPMGPSSFS